jgi:predicted Zn-dependent protease
MRTSWIVAVIALSAGPTAATPADDEPAVRAMKDELARSMDKLELPGLGKPYFLSYELWDSSVARAEASFGMLTRSSEAPRRFIDIDLRVGSHAFDNSNVADADRQSITITSDDDYGSIRRDLWLATDKAYKSAGETLERKQAVAKAESKGADDAPSFSAEARSNITDVTAVAALDVGKLETLAKKLSAVFRKNADVHHATAYVAESSGRRYFISSEGSQSIQTDHGVTILISCDTQADDGMPLHDSVSFTADRFQDLPSEAEMLAEVEKLSSELSALRKAPIVDDYGGPILFTGIAAGQVTRALLAENFSGTPAPKGDRPGMGAIGESELVGKIGQRILPVGTTVIDDPTLTKLGKLPVVGGYRFDEEGVPGTKVSLVENGTLKRFLMSRTPRKGFEHSTGHGRSTPLAPVRAHPSNLVISSTAKVADKKLLARALQTAKAAGTPYILVVEKLATIMGRDDFDPSMFSGGVFIPKPRVMKRVYVDGHEELVRGGSFSSLQLRSLKDLVGIGTSLTPYHYVASGLPARYDMMIPSPTGFTISIVCPPLLFRDIDVKKPLGPQKKPPAAPRPPAK